MRAHTKQVLLLVLAIVLASTTCDVPQTHVRIFNFIGEGIELIFHCKSRDDDLGQQVLVHFMDSWEFAFRPNIWGTTQYFCSFWWNDEAPKWFDIYYFPRDVGLCFDLFYCWWDIKPVGPCILTRQGLKCFPWNDRKVSFVPMP